MNRIDGMKQSATTTRPLVFLCCILFNLSILSLAFS